MVDETVECFYNCVILYQCYIILKRFTLKHYKIDVAFDFLSPLNWGIRQTFLSPMWGIFLY